MGWARQPRLRSPPLPGFRPDDHDHHQCRRGRTDRTDTVRRRQPRSGVTRAIIIMIMMSAGAWRTISGLPVPTCQAGDFRPRFHCPARVSESESLRPLASTGPAAEPARLFGPVGPCAKTKSWRKNFSCVLEVGSRMVSFSQECVSCWLLQFLIDQLPT